MSHRYHSCSVGWQQWQMRGKIEWGGRRWKGGRAMTHVKILDEAQKNPFQIQNAGTFQQIETQWYFHGLVQHYRITAWSLSLLESFFCVRNKLIQGIIESLTECNLQKKPARTSVLIECSILPIHFFRYSEFHQSSSFTLWSIC